ncbi:MAG: hypothetical protein WDZ82_02570 [Candidatus Paceibacterota bacterium]
MKYTRGISFIEVIIASAIIVLIITGVISAYSLWISEHQVSAERVKNAILLEEGLEAVRSIRDKDWSALADLSITDTHYLTFSTTTSEWQTTTEPEWIDGVYKRWFEVDDVSRDNDDRITESGGSNDPGTKQITVYAAWNDRTGTTTTMVSAYFTNLFEN